MPSRSDGDYDDDDDGERRHHRRRRRHDDDSTSRRRRRHRSHRRSSSRDDAPSRSRSRRRHRSSPSPPPKKAKNEIEDLTKDQRTVFVSQLVMKATERQVRSFFEKLGRVKDVIMIRDKYTNRHKGFAYVEMADLETVPMCLMLNGTLPDFQKFPILVKASEAEKNFLAKQEASVAELEAAEASAERAPVKPRRTLVLKNLHPQITPDDLKTVLGPFGKVEDVEMASREEGKALVTFANPDDALKASTRVGAINLGADDKPIMVEFAEEASAQVSAVGGGVATSDWRLDLDDSGMAMNPQSRAALMAQLGQRAGLGGATAAYQPVPKAAPPPLLGTPMAAMCMANMFDPATETEKNWRDDIKADVTAECEKYGPLLHVHVDAVSPRGLVHCLFEDVESARKAATSIHGRWFAGRAIVITYVDPRAHKAQ